MTKQRLVLFATLVIALLAFSSAWAQDATPEPTAEATQQSTTLSYGTPVTGTIDDTNLHAGLDAPHRLGGSRAGDRHAIQRQPDPGRADPRRRPARRLPTATGQITLTPLPRSTTTRFPDRGEYTVEVARDGGETGSTSGGYTLTVIPLGTADTNPNNQTIMGELQADTPVNGEITATHWQHLYTYTAQAADYIQVIATRTGGTLYPVVEIRDANGESMRTGYNDNASADTGSYELPVRRSVHDCRHPPKRSARRYARHL